MKKMIFVCAALFMVLFCCKKSDNIKSVEPVSNVGADQLPAKSTANSLSFPVSSNVELKLFSDAAWCKPTRVGDSVKVNLDENKSLDKRTAKVVVSASVGAYAKIVYVVQDGGPPYLSLDKKEAQYDEIGRTDSVIVNSNLNWDATSSADWCAVSKVNNKLVVKVRQSFQSTKRQAIVTIKKDPYTLVETFIVNQDAASFAVDKDGFSFPVAGGTDQTRVVATGTWTASSNTTWCTVVQMGPNVQITASTNTDRPRSAEVSIISGSKIAKIIVNQAGYTGLQLDQQALVEIYNSTGGAAWTTTWNLSTTVSSSWKGVIMAVVNGENRVTGLNLGNNNLVGTLPEKLGQLTELKNLILNNNSLKGGLPASIANLKNLTEISLQVNQGFFNGPVPVSISQLKQLSTLNLNTTGLTGTIPTWISNLSGLTTLVFSNNKLEGDMPVQITDLKLLRTFQTHSNNLTGSLPVGFGTVANLSSLEIRNNRFVGAIPADLKAHPKWSTFNLANICPQQSGFGFTNCN